MSAKMKRILTIAGICVAAVVFIAVMALLLHSCTKSSRYDKFYDRAADAYLSGDYDGAMSALEKAMDIDATEACYMLLANIHYFGYDDIDSAIAALYIASYTLDSKEIDARLEEYKALKASGGQAEEPAGEITVGGKTVALTTASLVLSQLRLTDADIAPLAGLTELTSLTLSDNGLTDVSALKDLTKLDYLHLGNNRLADVSPLSALINLKTLYLDGNLIEDYTALTGLKSLTTLSLKNMTITVEQLEELQAALPNCRIFTDELEAEPEEITLGGITFKSDVTELNLSSTNISDITLLAKCTELVEVDLRNNKISDLSPLLSLPKLEKLILWNNDVSDITPLMGMTSLTYVDLDSNNVTDITPLSGLTGLTELWLSDNKIKDFSPIGNLTALTRLGLKNTGLDNDALDMLKSLTGLVELRIQDNSDITAEHLDALKRALKGCEVFHSEVLYTVTYGGTTFKSDATELSASAAYVSDISGLSTFTSLTKIFMNDNSIHDISVLSGLTKLVVVELGGNSISNISSLKSLHSLSSLILSGNLITDLTPLSSCHQLSTLELSSNLIADITPLSSCTTLSRLYLDSNSINDVRALSSLTSLTVLSLENNRIEDIEPLRSLTNLKYLYLSGNELTAEEILDLQSALPNCTIFTDVDLSTPTPSPAEPALSSAPIDAPALEHLTDGGATA